MIASILTILGMWLFSAVFYLVARRIEDGEWMFDFDFEDDIPSTPTSRPSPQPVFNKKAYLQSAQWRALRLATLKRDHYTCQQCGIDNVPLDVHHIHYNNLGNEPLEDLVCVCRSCHQEIHNLLGYSRYGYYAILKD